MSSRAGWPQDYFIKPQVMQAHEHFVDMINGRTPIHLGAYYDAFQFARFGMDDETDSSDDSDNPRSTTEFCGLSRNFLHRPTCRVTEDVKTRPVTREEIKKAEKTAEELIEEEERLKKKAEKKKLKKLRQKEKKRLEKQEKENANKANDKQNKRADDKNKNQNKKSESPPGCNSDASSEEEDDQGSTSSEKEHPVKKKLLQKQEKKNYNKTNVDKQTISSNETVSSKAIDLNKSHHGKGQEYTDDSSDEEEGKQSDLEELDMNSCFVSNAAAALVKRQLEKTKEKKEKKDKKSVDSGKESPKPSIEQQNSKTHQKEVIPLSTQNPVKIEPERNPADLVARSMELAFIGNQYAANGNLEMAIKYFTDAIMHNPREYKLFGNRSFCFEKMQQYEKSLMDANVALSMNPQWIKGLYRKGRALTGLKRYMEAMHVYKEVLTLDKGCTDAAQELMRVQILELMEMGFTKEQSTNAMIIYGSVEKALDALSGLQGSYIPAKPQPQGDWVRVEKRSQSPKPVTEAGPTVQQPVSLIQPTVKPQPQPQPQPSAPTQPKHVKPELFPVWVGCPAQTLHEAFIYDLFNEIGPVHSVKVLRNKGCAFVNYIRKDDSEKAIKTLHGYIVAAGIPLQVRFPDRIHPHLGMSKTAVTERSDKLPDECYFWRTTGCVKSQNCQYRHVPENKGIDRNKVK